MEYFKMQIVSYSANTINTIQPITVKDYTQLTEYILNRFDNVKNV